MREGLTPEDEAAAGASAAEDMSGRDGGDSGREWCRCREHVCHGRALASPGRRTTRTLGQGSRAEGTNLEARGNKRRGAEAGRRATRGRQKGGLEAQGRARVPEVTDGERVVDRGRARARDQISRVPRSQLFEVGLRVMVWDGGPEVSRLPGAPRPQ